MKRMKKTTALLCAVCLVLSLAALSPALAANGTADGVSEYVYTVNIKVSNPCDSTSMDRDAVNVLYFDYYYKGQNGYQSEKSERFDMSWNGSANNNADFLKEHFIRPNDDECYTSYEVTLPGKLSRIYILLNMDGGERLSFEVQSVYCNGKRINSNTDYVSSAYNDSSASIYCSMESSVIDESSSPYFIEYGGEGLTEKEMSELAAGIGSAAEYAGQFRDQYNAVIDTAVLKNCISDSDGDINQAYAHSDEESMYRYTFYFNVENPIDLSNADNDEVETFYIEMSYIDKNGCGSAKTYKLDMSYSSSLKRNLNQKYLSCFESYGDDSYKTQFSVWVPGIVTEVRSKLNMSGEKLVVRFDRITLGSMAVNTERDYVSSVYYDSDAKIKCAVPASQIALDGCSLPESYGTELRDQYGALVSETLYKMAKEAPQRYLYHR